MTQLQTIPEALAERYLAALTALVSVAREAVAAGGSPQAGLWQRKVLPILEAHLSTAKAAEAHYAIGHQQPLLDAALPLRFLARDMDGYPLDFAGAALAQQLRQQRQLVVYAAWQVGHAAGAI